MADSGHVWLTYRELGEQLGMTRDGARMLAKRRGWLVSRANDGVLRVSVPGEALEGRANVANNVAGDVRERRERSRDVSSPSSRRAEEAYSALVDELRRRAEAGERESDRLREELAGVRDELREERQRSAGERRELQRALAVTQERLDQLHRDRRDDADAHAEEVAALRSEVERLRLPWWRRIVGR